MNSLLQQILEQYNPDRIVVALIHPKPDSDFNWGEHHENNTHVYQFSIKYEVCKNSIKSILKLVQNKPLSILIKEDPFYIDDLLFIKNDSSLPLLCENHLKKIEASILLNQYLIIEELIVGVVSLQYKSLDSCPYQSYEDCKKDYKELMKIGSTISKELFDQLV